MPKKVIVKVEIGEAAEREVHIGPILDMLRYAGLLRSNVPGFPKIVEYESKWPDSEIERWKSYGFKAEVIKPQ